MRARGARGEGRKGHAYIHIRIIFIIRQSHADSDAQLVPVSLSDLEYVADITYTLRHDAWPKSLVPISPSVYVCMSKPIRPLSDGRIEKKKRKERGEREEKKRVNE